MQETEETQVPSLGWEDPLEKEMTTHPSILAWEIPWTEEPGGLQPMGSQRVGHSEWTTTSKSHRGLGRCYLQTALEPNNSDRRTERCRLPSCVSCCQGGMERGLKVTMVSGQTTGNLVKHVGVPGAETLPLGFRKSSEWLSHLMSFFFFFFCFLATLCSMQDLSSPARDWTRARCRGSMVSWPLTAREIPQTCLTSWGTQPSVQQALHIYIFFYDAS